MRRSRSAIRPAADAIWEHAGTAIPLQINFALSGAARIIREIRAALNRREREQAVALLAAREDIGTELRKTVTGLLLQSQLALSQSGVPTVVAEKLRVVADLAGTLRQQLSAPPPGENGCSFFHQSLKASRVIQDGKLPASMA